MNNDDIFYFIRNSFIGNLAFDIRHFWVYQLAFFIPGNCPLRLSSLKQIRQIPKSRIKPRGRPQIEHRRLIRVENLGFLFALLISAFLAMSSKPFRYT